VDFVEICNVYIGKMIIKAVKCIFNSNKICRSYSDLNFGVTFLEHSVVSKMIRNILQEISNKYLVPSLRPPPLYNSTCGQLV